MLEVVVLGESLLAHLVSVEPSVWVLCQRLLVAFLALMAVYHQAGLQVLNHLGRQVEGAHD